MLAGDLQLGGDAAEAKGGTNRLLEGGGEEIYPPIDMKKTVKTKSQTGC